MRTYFDCNKPGIDTSDLRNFRLGIPKTSSTFANAANVSHPQGLFKAVTGEQVGETKLLVVVERMLLQKGISVGRKPFYAHDGTGISVTSRAVRNDELVQGKLDFFGLPLVNDDRVCIVDHVQGLYETHHGRFCSTFVRT